MGYSTWGHKDLDTAEHAHTCIFQLGNVGEMSENLWARSL